MASAIHASEEQVILHVTSCMFVIKLHAMHACDLFLKNVSIQILNFIFTHGVFCIS